MFGFLRKAMGLKGRHDSNRAQFDDTSSPRPIPILDTQSVEYVYNRTESALGRLPVELQLLIADFLSPTAIISLRLASRHFCRLLPNPSKIDPIEMHQFTKIKEADNYNWNCRRERSLGLSKLEKLTYSVCKCLHPISEFSSDQMRTAQERRRCKGAEGVLWICRHSCVSVEDIIALVNKKVQLSSTDIQMYDFRICTHLSHGYTANELVVSAPLLCVVPEGGNRPHGSLLVLRSWRVMQLSVGDTPTEKDLINGLVALDEALCPHTSTKNTATIYPKWTADPKSARYPFYVSQLDDNPPACGSGACRVCSTFARFCRSAHCDTSWIIYRRHNNPAIGPDEIILSVKRQITPGWGQNLMPQNCSWLAQIRSDRPTNSELERERTCFDGETFLSKYGTEIEPAMLYARSQGI